MGVGTQVSLAEYLSTTYEPDREYVDGELKERGVGTYKHGRLQGKLAAEFERLASSRKFFAGTEIRLKLGSQHYRIPDVCVFIDEEPQMAVPNYPPEVAVEIVSPDDRYVDIIEKLEEYRAFGVRNIWLIDPERKHLNIFDSSGLREVVSLTLPEFGFEVTAADLF